VGKRIVADICGCDYPDLVVERLHDGQSRQQIALANTVAAREPSPSNEIRQEPKIHSHL